MDLYQLMNSSPHPDHISTCLYRLILDVTMNCYITETNIILTAYCENINNYGREFSWFSSRLRSTPSAAA